MDQKRFDEIATMIFARLNDHEKKNTTCLLPIIDEHLDVTRCIPILNEVADIFNVSSEELTEVLGELIDTSVLLVVPNKSGRWGLIIYEKK